MYTMKVKRFNLVDSIIDFENGDLDNAGTLKLFSYLIKTGKAWSLQGFYGRTAAAFIDAGVISKTGKILRHGKVA